MADIVNGSVPVGPLPFTSTLRLLLALLALLSLLLLGHADHLTLSDRTSASSTMH
jgi:hypothetical protein